MSFKHFYLLLFWWGAGIDGLSAQAPCEGILQGRIVEAKTGEPLAFASALIQNSQKGALADKNGYFSVANCCEGATYLLTIRMIGYAPLTKKVVLAGDQFFTFQLKHGAALEEVLILEKAVATPVNPIELKVNKQDYNAGLGAGWSEMLKRLPGVQPISTGPTLVKPMIQGLHSSRVAMVNNNVVHGSQSWGEDHAPEIDPATAGAVHIVKGAAGVRYGVGAMGGAVILEPPPLRHERGVGGWVALNGASNGRRYAVSGALDGYIPRLQMGSRVSFSWRRSGNMRTPDYYLDNTGTQDYSMAWLTGWRRYRWAQELAFSSVNQKNGMLRTAYVGNLTDLTLALESPVPVNNADTFTYKIGRPRQEIGHHQAKYRITYLAGDHWKISGQYAFQYNKRDEYTEEAPLSDPDDALNRPQLSMLLYSNTTDLAAEHFYSKHLKGGGGLQVFQQTNLVSTGSFIPDYTTWGGALWCTEKWQPPDSRFAFDAGIRNDYRKTNVRLLDDFRSINKTLVFNNVSGALGMDYQLNKKCSINVHSGYAWRPPNIIELYARGIQVSAAAYKEGDSTLRTERALNTNITVQWKDDALDWSVSAWRNQIWDFIYLNPRQTGIETIKGAFLAYDYTQNDAVIQGVDLAADLTFAKRASLGTKLSILEGFRTNPVAQTGAKYEWLPLMPAVRWIYDMKWYWGKQTEKRPANNGWGSHTRTTKPKRVYERDSYIRFSTEIVLQQRRIPFGGILKAAPPTYNVFNADIARSFYLQNTKLFVGLSARNLLNQRYRDYLNFFRYFADETGRNISLWANVSLN